MPNSFPFASVHSNALTQRANLGSGVFSLVCERFDIIHLQFCFSMLIWFAAKICYPAEPGRSRDFFSSLRRRNIQCASGPLFLIMLTNFSSPSFLFLHPTSLIPEMFATSSYVLMFQVHLLFHRIKPRVKAWSELSPLHYGKHLQIHFITEWAVHLWFIFYLR